MSDMPRIEGAPSSPAPDSAPRAVVGPTGMLHTEASGWNAVQPTLPEVSALVDFGVQAAQDGKKAVAAVTLMATLAACAPGPDASPTPYSSPSFEPTPAVSQIPSASPDVTPMPTQSPDISLPPSQEPTPPPPTPTPSASTEPTPIPTPTETAPQSKKIVEIINSIAQFDPGGELESTQKNLQINYSRKLLDGAGIQSISVNPDVMSSVRDKIVEETYKAARQVGQSGQGTIELGDDITTIKADLNSSSTVLDYYALSSEEYSALSDAISQNNIEAVHNAQLSRTFIIVYQANTLYLFSQGEYGLGNTPDSWDQKDAANRIVAEGPANAMQNLKLAALNAYADEYDLTPPDPVYITLGLNNSNDWGYNGARGKLDIKFS